MDNNYNSNNDYEAYNYETYYNNSNSSFNNNYKKDNKSIMFKLILCALVCIVFILGLYCFYLEDNNDELYFKLTTRMCEATQNYVTSNLKYNDKLKAGKSIIIKFRELADANLIEAKIKNPYYDGNLLKNGTQEKYYSMDNSIRIYVMNDGKLNCEIVNNSNDVRKPNLVLNGDKEIVMVVGTKYEDPGYVATDDYDGDISDNVVISGNVDSSKSGEYDLNYTVQDSAGNVTSTNRKIIYKNYSDIDISLGSISDNVAPKILLKGENPYCLVKGSKYEEPGVMAIDNIDGDITDRISVTNNITGNLMGSFRIMYKVTDSAGNESVNYRAVMVTTKCLNDNETEKVVNNRPNITLIGKNSVIVDIGTEYIDLGATAYDKEDGNITNKIITDATSVNTSLPGIYKVIYRVTDTSGVTSTITRIVTVKQKTSLNPVVMFIEDKENIEVLVGKGSNTLIKPPKAVDENKNQVNVSIKIEDYLTKKQVNEIDWSDAGKYRVIYTANHKNGSLRQIKSIVVKIDFDNFNIGENKKINVVVRNENCDINEADLIKGGISFQTNSKTKPVISLSNNLGVACKKGEHDVKVSVVYSNGENIVKSSEETIIVNIVDGNSKNDLLEQPGRVEIISNSANVADPYNKSNKWIGGEKTGITLKFQTKSNVDISRFEYSTDCQNVAGVVGIQNKNGNITNGTLNWSMTGKNTICIRAVTIDNVEGPWSDIINTNIDVLGPSVKFVHTWGDNKEDWHNKPNMTLEYYAIDEESGLSHFEYTYDDVKAKKAEDIVTYNEATGKLTIYENTEPTRKELFVYVRAVDKAGNKGEWTPRPAFVNIDTVSPLAPTLTVTGNNTKLVKINASFTDGKSVRASGFGKLIYTINDGKEEIQETDIITMPANTSNNTINYLVKVWAVDKAGNKSSSYSQKTVNVLANGISATSITLKNGNNTVKNNANCTVKTVNPGSTLKLEAMPVPSNSDEKEVIWSSSDNNIASIDKNGNISSKMPGTTYITAKIGNAVIKCKLEVVSMVIKVDKITLDKEKYTLEKGNTQKVVAKISPSDATNKGITWSSSNKNVATVKNGTITAVGVGKATITAKTENGKKVSAEVIVNKPKLNISNTKITLIDENSKKLTATLSVKSLDKGVIWSSSDTKIAKVDENGNVKAKSTGTVTITATSKYDSSITAKCEVKVRAARYLFVGNSKTYYPEMQDDNAGIPKRFKDIAKNAGYEIEYVSAVVGGKSLKQIIENYPDRVNKIKSNYDYVILQDGTSTIWQYKNSYYNSVNTIKKWVEEKNKDVNVYVRKTWVRVKQDENANPKDGSTQEQINKSYENAEYIAKKLGVKTINDGALFYDVMDNHKNINILLYQTGLKTDFVHQTATGAYLSALCIFSEVYDKDPTKITYNAGIYEDTANTLKKMAKKHCYNN